MLLDPVLKENYKVDINDNVYFIIGLELFKMLLANLNNFILFLYNFRG